MRITTSKLAQKAKISREKNLRGKDFISFMFSLRTFLVSDFFCVFMAMIAENRIVQGETL
jgi:hypothetical protein